jgi:integrase
MAGKGCVEKRGEGVWRLVITDGRKPGGGYYRYKKVVKAASKRDAEAMLGDFQREVRRKEVAHDKRMTLAHWLTRWISDHCRDVAPRTLYRYAQQVARTTHGIGPITLAALRPIDIDAWLRWLSSCKRNDGKAGTLSARTVHHHFRMISTALQRAVDLEIIPANPAKKVQAPRVERRSARFYDEDAVGSLLEALDTEPVQFRAFVLLAVTTGARRGELSGMRWGDLDVARATWRIQRALSYVPGKPLEVKNPKNDSSIRAVALPATVMAVLEDHRRYQARDISAAGDLWEENDYVFRTNTGRVVHPDFWRNTWVRFLGRHGLPSLNLHGLRHTAATLLIGAGVPARTVAGRLGHSSVSTTTDLYAHHLVSADRSAADHFEGIVNKKST